MLLTYQSIACSINRWDTFRDDVYVKLGIFQYNYVHFLSSINALYTNISKYLDSAGKGQFSSYNQSVTNNINNFANSLRNLKSSLDRFDASFKPFEDSLIKKSYANSISAIYNSIQTQKSCIVNFVAAFEDVYGSILTGLQQCSNQTVDIGVIMSELSYSFSSGLALAGNLNGCVSTSNPPSCIKAVIILLTFFIGVEI